MSTYKECPDQTARMRTLIWTFAFRMRHKGLFPTFCITYFWKMINTIKYDKKPYSGIVSLTVLIPLIYQVYFTIYEERIHFYGESTLSKLFNFPPFWKGVYSKRKVLLRGSRFFHFKVGPFSEATWCAGKQTGGHKRCHLWNKTKIAENLS